MRHAWDCRPVLISVVHPSTSGLGMAMVGFFSYKFIKGSATVGMVNMSAFISVGVVD